MSILKLTDPELWTKAGLTFKESLEAVTNPTAKEITEALQAGYDTVDEFSDFPDWIDSIAKYNVLPLIGSLLESGIKKWVTGDQNG